MQPIKNTIETDFTLGGVSSAIDDAKNLAKGIRDALDGLSKIKPLDGIAESVENIREAAGEASQHVNLDVSVGVNGVADAISVIKGFGKSLRDALDDAKPEQVVDFDAVRNRLKGATEAAKQGAEGASQATTKTRTVGQQVVGVFKTLRDLVLSFKAASDDATESVDKIGKKAKASGDGAEKAVRGAGDRLKTMKGRGDDAGKSLTELGKKSKEASERLKAMGDRGGEATRSVLELGKRGTEAGKKLGEAFKDKGIEGLRKVGEYAKEAAKIGAVVAGIGALGEGGIFGSLTEGTADYTREVEKLSNLTGIEVTAFSRLASLAHKSGVELDDLRGAFGQFTGQASAASRGEDVQKYFDALGVSVTGTDGKLKEILPLLLEVAAAQKKLTGGQRAEALSQLFGEDDSAKLVLFLDKLGGSATDLKTAIEAVDKSGDIVTPEDVKQANAYKEAIGTIAATLHGLGRTIAREVLPQVAVFAKDINGVIESSRDGIAKFATKSWSLLADVIKDVIRYISGGDRDYTKNSWLLPILDTVGAVARGLGAAGRAALEFGDILRGKTVQDKDFEFPWLFDLRDRFARAFGAAGRVVTAFVKLITGINVDVTGAANVANNAVDGLANQAENALQVLSGDAKPITWLGGVAKDGQDAYNWLIRLKNAVLALANGQTPDPEFAWVVTLKGNIERVQSSLTTMAAAVSKTAGEISGLLEKLGLTDGSTSSLATNVGLLVVAYAALGGPLKLASSLFGGLVTRLGALGLLTGAAAVVWKKVYDNYEEEKAAEEELRNRRADVEATYERNGPVAAGGEKGMEAYRRTQLIRQAMGLDYDKDLVGLNIGNADALRQRITDQQVNGAVRNLVVQAANSNGVGSAIAGAAASTAPSIVDRAAPVATGSPRAPIVITLVNEAGVEEQYEFDDTNDVGAAFQEALLRQSRGRTTVRQPRFANGG